MKRSLLFLALLPITAGAIPNQIRFEQKNAADTAWVLRLINNPPGTTPGIFFMDGSKAIRWVNLSAGFTYDPVTHDLVAAGTQSDWSASVGPSSILNKPSPAAVAITGAYSDLMGIPPDQVQTDWNAVSGMGELLNKPTFATVATTGAYADLTGQPSLFDGTWGSLTGKPSTFTPSAHTHDASDIVSGTLADARIPSLAISKTTGLQTALDGKFPNPAGTTSQYVRGDGSLATLPAAPAFSVGNPSARTFALATGYQCTTPAKPCLFTITLQAQSAISLLGASNNEGQILIGSTSAVGSGTGTVTATYKNNLSGTLVVGLNLNSQQANTYSVFVPANQWAAVRQTAGSGLQVVSVLEQVLQ